VLKNPINVIHIMPQVGTGGAEHQLLELIRGSDPDMVRHRVIYYSESYDTSMLDRYRSQGVSLERDPTGAARYCSLLAGQRQLLGAYSGDYGRDQGDYFGVAKFASLECQRAMAS
jgi:hypothetical protein